MNSKYRVFLESFIVAVVIFLVGISSGFYVEGWRNSKVIENYKNNEIEALDLKLQNYYYQVMDQSSCSSAIEQNFIFADKLYDEGLIIEKYEEANQISEELKNEKRRYVLLKSELWLNTIILKQKCKNPFDTVVYIYESDPKSNAKIAEQKIISNVLKDIKDEKGNKIVLIPMANDLDLGIVDLQLRNYNVTDVPAVIINEKTVLIGFQSVENIKKYLKK